MLWSSLATRLFFFFILRGKKEDLIGHQSNTTKRIFSGKGVIEIDIGDPIRSNSVDAG